MIFIFIRYKYWPFQIFIHEKSAQTGKAKSKEPSNARIFQCYVDVTQLLFPGSKFLSKFLKGILIFSIL